MTRKDRFSRVSNGYSVDEVEEYIEQFQTDYGSVLKITEKLFKETDRLAAVVSELSESNQKLRKENNELYNDCIVLAKSLNAQAYPPSGGKTEPICVEKCSELFDEKISELFNKYLSDLHSAFTALVDSAISSADSFISDANNVKATVLSHTNETVPTDRSKETVPPTAPVSATVPQVTEPVSTFGDAEVAPANSDESIEILKEIYNKLLEIAK